MDFCSTSPTGCSAATAMQRTWCRKLSHACSAPTSTRLKTNVLGFWSSSAASPSTSCGRRGFDTRLTSDPGSPSRSSTATNQAIRRASSPSMRASASPCSSSSSGCRLLSGWCLCFTTFSIFHLRRSRRWSTERRQHAVSWPAGRGVASRKRPAITGSSSILINSDASSTRSSRRPRPVTSRRFFRSSTHPSSVGRT